MDELGSKKYKVIKNFLTEEELGICKLYFNESSRTSLDFSQDNVNLDVGKYKDSLTQVFLKTKKDFVSKVVGLELLPTYSFWRCYTYQSTLPKHTDRPSCEYSITVCVDADKPNWPLYLGGTAVPLEPGDGIVYKGREVPHWRDVYEGDYHIQFFLHYVNKNGDLADYENDQHRIPILR